MRTKKSKLTEAELKANTRLIAAAPELLGLPMGTEEACIAAARDPGDMLENIELHDAITEALGKLSLRHRQIVELRWGIDPEGPLTLDEIGHRFGITRERARQLLHEGMRTIALQLAPSHPEALRWLRAHGRTLDVARIMSAC